jgi:hypothetical protein
MNNHKGVLSVRFKVILALLATYAVVAVIRFPNMGSPRAARPSRSNDVLADDGPITARAPAPPAPRSEPRPRRELAPDVTENSGVVSEPARQAAIVDGAPYAFDGESGDPFVDQKISAIREQWERESDDPTWSEQARGETLALFAEHHVPGELLHDVRCRRTVCRISVDATDRLRMAGLAQHLTDNVPSAYFSIVEDQAFAYVPR